MTGSDSGGYVFISYARDDGEYVKRMVAYLRANEVSVWYDEDTPNGVRWRKYIESKVENAAAVLVIGLFSAVWLLRGSDTASPRVAFSDLLRDVAVRLEDRDQRRVLTAPERLQRRLVRLVRLVARDRERLEPAVVELRRGEHADEGQQHPGADHPPPPCQREMREPSQHPREP